MTICLFARTLRLLRGTGANRLQFLLYIGIVIDIVGGHIIEMDTLFHTHINTDHIIRNSAEFTKPLEYKLFMPFGTYKIEAKDERWIMR